MRLFITSICICLMFGCKNDVKNESSRTSKTNESIQLDTLLLSLNNGNKWIANQETQDGVVAMSTILSVFNSSEVKDYKVLGKDLSEQTSSIIKNCSMKDEPHDQLHIVLVPMLDEISVLKESESSLELERALAKLEVLIKDYFAHFETQ